MDKFKSKALTGYFIMLRDSIPDLPSDVAPLYLDFDVFYVHLLDSSIIENLKKYNVPNSDTVTFIYGNLNYAICDRKDYLDYLNYLRKKDFDKIEYQSPFSKDSISTELLNSKKRFISIYKGTINVIGPFWSCIQPFFHMPILQKVYEYIPPFKKAVYMKTIVF